jgi:hypothetical protein
VVLQRLRTDQAADMGREDTVGTAFHGVFRTSKNEGLPPGLYQNASQTNNRDKTR